jgi:hypothetical protein
VPLAVRSAPCAIVTPGGFPNSINPQNLGKIPVAIISTTGFPAPTQVDQRSLTFGHTGSEQSLAFCSSQDVNGDGIVDLVCHFYSLLTGFQTGDTQGILRGKTVSGTPIYGTDSVVITQDIKGGFKFEGVISGALLQIRIIPFGNNNFDFTAEGQRAGLAATANPVTVGLRIGYDGGSASVTAELK